MHSRNSLERLVEADGGGAVEDDVDVLDQDALVLLAEVQLRLREVTVDGDDLLRKARLLLLQSLKELGAEPNGSQLHVSNQSTRDAAPGLGPAQYRPWLEAAAATTAAHNRAHLAVDHVGDAGVRALTRLWPDHHVGSVDSRAGPQQLLQQHL